MSDLSQPASENKRRSSIAAQSVLSVADRSVVESVLTSRGGSICSVRSPSRASVSKQSRLSKASSVPILPGLRTPKKPTLAEKLALIKRVRPDPGHHLRAHPVNQGMPAAWTSCYQHATNVAVQMAVDPKWSTELKEIDYQAQLKNQFNVRLTAPVGTVVGPAWSVPSPEHLS
mmetsp:Transcript_45864/g.106616  ORF Transcript_45864/g.106616 Transcript_45864/m.106616 type:complete len:173 (+) Transcript_45864:63-581(+)